MLTPQIESYLQHRYEVLVAAGLEDKIAVDFIEELFRAGHSYCKQQIKDLKLDTEQE